ncbi:MAG: hypothetical protein GY810_22060 [Aureispira sp.]|nr:hypothetical protein [Aureispira sp.]
MKKSIKELSTKEIKNIKAIKGGNNLDELIINLGGADGKKKGSGRG